MGQFYYEALQKNGQKSSGTVEANDRTDAFQKLSRDGLEPFKIEAAAVGENSKPRSQIVKRSGGLFSKRAQSVDKEGRITLKPKEVILFTEELSDLLQAGLQLEPALRSMEGRGELSNLKSVAQQLRERVRDGMNFSAALKNTSSSFGDLYVNLAAAGEASGALPQILSRQAIHLGTIQELKAKVSLALIYPAFLMFSGLAVFLVFITYLIPKLTELVKNTGSKLPPVAQFLVGISDFVKSFWWVFPIVIVIGVVAFIQFTKSERYRPEWDRIKLGLPFIGNVLRANFYVQFLETMANLMGNGLEMLKSLELVRNATPNLYLKTRLTAVVAEVRDGIPISKSLRRSDEFPPLLTDLVRVGEETGQMSEAMARAGARFDKELAVKIERINALVQPVIILLMAGAVGSMAYLMITIIYETISTLRSR